MVGVTHVNVVVGSIAPDMDNRTNQSRRADLICIRSMS